MNFAWTDIETTGLNAAEEEILEVSVVVTDAHTLEEKGRFHSLVGPRFHGENDQVFDSFESWFDTWDDWPKAAHTENGLVEDLRIAWEEGSLKSLGKVEDELACFFAEHNGDDRKSLYIAGNSVKFDFGFFEQKMPKVLEHTHYRVADVSSTTSWKASRSTSTSGASSNAGARVRIRSTCSRCRFPKNRLAEFVGV
jgi:oligoribonuclease (3'-5' exoribonuclease)